VKPRILRNSVILALDAAMAAASFVVALYLRWADAMWVHARDYWWQGAVLMAVVMALLLLLTRYYRRLWRYISLKDMVDLTKVALAALVIFYAMMFLTTRLEMLPRSVPVIQALVLLAVLCAPRFAYRALHEHRLQLPKGKQVPVLLIGATADAESFIRESMRSPSFPYRVVGIVATEDAMIGHNIHNVRVFGGIKDIPAILRKLKRRDDPPQRMIIADPYLDGDHIRSILEMSDQEGVALARMPQLSDLTRGDRDKFDIRPIDVEDILGRPQMKLDLESMRAVIAGKTVLITGAGGSIGSELVRQVAAFSPTRVVLFDQGEFNLYAIDRELAEKHPDLPRHAVIGDVRDATGVQHMMSACRPQVVFHAAALKHVPLCETNVEEAILTNVIGTRHVVDACVASGVELMVQISTDKAVNPTNVMGACKRVGEYYCQALGQSSATTRFITVRFGNVLGSTGSVVPLFQQQLKQGGPLTITHPDMTRYFMSIREAVQLVIQAAALGQKQTEQPAPIFVLDMGSPIRIADLAQQMIRLAGLRVGADIEIVYTGLRPGEKLYEELFYDAEALAKTDHASIHLAAARQGELSMIRRTMDAMHQSALSRDSKAALALLQQLIPEYQPQSNTEEKKAV